MLQHVDQFNLVAPRNTVWLDLDHRQKVGHLAKCLSDITINQYEPRGELRDVLTRPTRSPAGGKTSASEPVSTPVTQDQGDDCYAAPVRGQHLVSGFLRQLDASG